MICKTFSALGGGTPSPKVAREGSLISQLTALRDSRERQEDMETAAVSQFDKDFRWLCCRHKRRYSL